MLMLKDVLNVPKLCIYALICDDSKRVMVKYTKCLLTAMDRLTKDLETPKYMLLKNDVEKVRIEILEQGIPYSFNTKAKVTGYVQSYIDKGYTEYYPSNPVSYTAYKDVFVFNKYAYYGVYIKRNKQSPRIIVGLFRDKKERDEFYTTYYKDGKVRAIQYASTIFTKNHINNMGYKVE